MYDPLPLIHLHRTEQLPDWMLGELRVYDAGGVLRFEGYSLEPPWRDNRIGESCIPPGLYDVRRRWSRRYREHLIVEGTAPRSFILLHAGNYARDTRGCILPGLGRADLDGDGQDEVTSSRKALGAVLDIVGEQCRLLVTQESPGVTRLS
jgi:hypothetical protein